MREEHMSIDTPLDGFSERRFDPAPSQVAKPAERMAISDDEKPSRRNGSGQ
jgi:hypothetical protein